MQIEGIRFSKSINKIPVKTAKVTEPIKNAVAKNIKTGLGISAAALSGAYIISKAVQEKATETAQNPQIEVKIDKDALIAIATFAPKLREYMLKHPENIKEVSFTTASKETNNFDIYKFLTKDGSLDFEFYTRMGHIHKVSQSTVNKKDQSKTTTLKELIYGTKAWRSTVTKTDKNGVKQYVKVQTPVINDSLGLMYKSEIEQTYNKDGKVNFQKINKLDGGNSVLNIEYDKKGRQKSSVKTEYSSSGIVTAKTINKYSYETEIDPKTNKEEITYQKRTAEVINYKNNSKTIAVLSGKGFRVLESEIKEYKNPKTGKVRKEILEKSDVQGIYNSKIIEEDGAERIESKAEKDLHDNVKIEKHFTSLDGTKTDYDYQSTKDNSHVQLKLQITDKNGKALTTVDRTFDRISEDKAISSLNGYKHSLNYNKDGIIIEDLYTGKKETIKYKNLFTQESDITKENIDFVKTMTADMLLNLKERNLTIRIAENTGDSHCNYQKKEIYTGKNLLVFSHESGHSRDKIGDNGSLRAGMLNGDSTFKKIYEEEKSAFLKNFSDLEKSYISYFINDIDSYSGINGAPAETIAEINAMFSTGVNHIDSCSSRFHYLQKYFPKTVAYMTSQINPKANIAFVN